MLIARPSSRVHRSVAQHLHVARQDHEIDVVRGDQLHQPGLGLGLGVGGDRDVHERQSGRLDHRPQVSWFDATTAISAPRLPARQRKIRSFRQ